MYFCRIVESEVIETDLRDWECPSEPVDLILLFQVLYFFGDDERQELYQKMHDRWLTPGGYVAIVQASRTKSRGSVQGIMELLGSPTVAWEDMPICRKLDSSECTPSKCL